MSSSPFRRGGAFGRRSTCLSALCLVLALWSCSDDEAPRTEVVLVIDAEPDVRERTESLELATAGAARREDLAEPGDARTLASGDFRWPRRVLLTPMGDDASRVFVAEVAARDGDGTIVVEARVESGYVAGERVELDILLQAACIDPRCPRLATCSAGVCVDPWVDPRDPGAERSPIMADAGSDSGHGHRDAGVDAGEDGGAARGQDAGRDGGALADVDAGDAAVVSRDAAPDTGPDCGRTTDDPCSIDTCQDLSDIRSRPEARYALAGDVDCSAEAFVPIPSFAGSLDGGGHAIGGLTIAQPDTDGAALFALLDGARVSSLAILGASIQGRDRVAVLAAQAHDARIERVHVDGSAAGRGEVAGLVGRARGGLIRDSYSTVDLHAESGALLVGGSDAAETTTLRDSYAAAAVDGGVEPRLVAGDGVAATASFHDCKLSGQCDPTDPHALPTQRLKRFGWLAAIGWDFATPVWGSPSRYDRPCLAFEPACEAQSSTTSAPPGAGTAGDPYRITTCAQLQWIARAPDASYVLATDVDCTRYDAGDRLGFQPIGSRATPFSGVLDGQGHAVVGLRVRRPWLDDAALFGHVTGRVSDLSVREALVVGGRRVAVLAGGLSGAGTIERCSVNGDVLARSEAGAVAGSVQGAATITDCSSTVAVTAKE